MNKGKVLLIELLVHVATPCYSAQCQYQRCRGMKSLIKHLIEIARWLEEIVPSAGNFGYSSEYMPSPTEISNALYQNAGT